MAGRIRLAVTGIQDQWLTGEPQFSYFVMNYKRHTRFSTEAVEMPFDGKCDFSSSVECRIPQNIGDLIRSTMLKIKLGKLSTDTSTEKYRYNTPAALSIIKYVDLVIGGQIIERLTGDYIYMYNQLHNNKDDVNQSLYFLSGHGEHLQVSDSYNTFYVNIPFYFFRNPSLAVPVCAITKQLVEVRVTFKDINDDVTFKYTIDGSVTKRDKTTEGSIDNVSLITDFYFVAEEEKNFLLTRPMEYIISQLQMSKLVYKPNESKKSALLKFKHPVKELFFSAKEKTGLNTFFSGSIGSYEEIAKIPAPIQNDRLFGRAVSIDGDTMVISDLNDTDRAGQPNSQRRRKSGAVHVFTRVTAGDPTSGWTWVTKLVANEAMKNDNMGFRSVVIDGDTLIAGTPFDDFYDHPADFNYQSPIELNNAGSAYIFTRDTPGDLTSGWTQVAKLVASDVAGGDNFGYGVSISGDTAVVGAWADDDTLSSSGSAYIFTRDTPGDLTSGWTQFTKLNATPVKQNSAFGYSVSIDADTVVIGSHDNEEGTGPYPYSNTDTGSVYVFTRDIAGDLTAGWTQIANLFASDAEGLSYPVPGAGGPEGDHLGTSVSINGDTIAVAGSYDYDGFERSGSAYIFTRDTPGDLTSGWTEIAKLTPTEGTATDEYGSSISVSGDIVVVGAFGDDTNGSDGGCAYVFTRDTPGDLTSGWTQGAKLTASDAAADPDGGAAGNQFGCSAATDGTTVIVGSQGDYYAMHGAVYVYRTPTFTQSSSDQLLDTSITDQEFTTLLPGKRSDHRLIKNVKFACNGETIFDQSGQYLAYEQSLRHHTGCPDPAFEFYSYSFSLKPEQHYPSGQLNMSRIMHKKIDIELEETSTKRDIDVSVYALNYNVLHVASGLVGLKF